MARPLNRQIVEENLPPDVRDLVRSVTANVDRAVDNLIEEFKKNMVARAEAFTPDRYPEELRGQLEFRVRELDREFADVAGAAGKLREAATALVAKAEQAGASAEELRAIIGRLQEASQGLDAELNEFRGKVNSFGEKAGHSIAAAALKAITGGIG